MTVVEVHASIGDGAELAHTSSLHAGQSIPAGQRWVGSPAEPAALPPSRLSPAVCTRARRLRYGIVQLGTDILVFTPALLALAGLIIPHLGRATARTLVDPGF
jgi:hypothetical protein